MNNWAVVPMRGLVYMNSVPSSTIVSGQATSAQGAATIRPNRPTQSATVWPPSTADTFRRPGPLTPQYCARTRLAALRVRHAAGDRHESLGDIPDR